MDQSGTRESSFPAFQSRQALMVFRDILDTVLHLSDEEWKTLTEDMTHQYTKQKFVSLCTEIVTSMSESVIGKMMPDLIERFGIESVLRAKAKLKEKDECESRSRSATPSCSGQSLPEDSSDLVQNSIQTAITKIKAAMQEAIRRVASGKKIKTGANKIFKSLKKISRKSHVKLESGDSVQLKNRATWDVSDLLVKHFSRVLKSLDPSVVTTSDAKEMIEIVVSGLVSAAEEKDDDRVSPVYIAKNGRVREARKNARVLANLIAEPFFKSNRAGGFVRTCSSDSLFETAGTEVNTVNSIPSHSETIYTFAEESTECLPSFIGSPVKPDFSAESKKGDDAAVIPISVIDDGHVHQITDQNKPLFKKGKDTVLESNMCLSKCVQKQSSKRPPLPWSNEGASCSSSEVISCAGAEHEAEKNILDRPAGRLSPLFKGSPENPDFSAESKKDDDRGILIDITGDASAPERTAENELLLKQKKNTVREKANVLTNLKAKVFFKSNRAGRFGRTCPSDSLHETAGTEVNTINSIPHYSKNNTFSESKRCLPKCVLKPRPERPPLPRPKQGASCSTPEVISGSGAEHEAEKKILDRPAEKDTVREQADSLRETAGTISHGGSAVWFDIILEKNPPINCCDFKKENNGRADILKVSEQPTGSTKEDLPMTSHGESNGSRRFRNFRKRLTRSFSRIYRACTSCGRDQSTL
ncbi:uncharacterized protein LOC108270427 [Ictalurus punctatus]|uniref:Uncharacterized protein LOC108270427 n=1 Tax=Ictalurus punctatus TaxID=7998 RepID=A0A2D0RQ38_ICTPU|nr:uncharacterized protein LOC108270427 [Ictalurus punctatus]